jgi:hypothetical protein
MSDRQYRQRNDCHKQEKAGADATGDNGVVMLLRPKKRGDDEKEESRDAADSGDASIDGRSYSSADLLVHISSRTAC